MFMFFELGSNNEVVTADNDSLPDHQLCNTLPATEHSTVEGSSSSILI